MSAGLPEGSGPLVAPIGAEPIFGSLLQPEPVAAIVPAAAVKGA